MLHRGPTVAVDAGGNVGVDENVVLIRVVVDRAQDEDVMAGM
jgi:hypothetical protein